MDNSLPGLSGVSVYNITDFILFELRNYDLNIRSKAVAFSYFLSI